MGRKVELGRNYLKGTSMFERTKMTKVESLDISYSNSVVLSGNDNPNQVAKDLCTSTEAHLVSCDAYLTINN